MDFHLAYPDDRHRDMMSLRQIAVYTCYTNSFIRTPRSLQGLASSDHTTLLLNCYAKLRDTAKLDRFLRAEGPGGKPALSFDVDTAIKASAFGKCLISIHQCSVHEMATLDGYSCGGALHRQTLRSYTGPEDARRELCRSCILSRICSIAKRGSRGYLRPDGLCGQINCLDLGAQPANIWSLVLSEGSSQGHADSVQTVQPHEIPLTLTL
jgi:hypothetical protein